MDSQVDNNVIEIDDSDTESVYTIIEDVNNESVNERDDNINNILISDESNGNDGITDDLKKLDTLNDIVSLSGKITIIEVRPENNDVAMLEVSNGKNGNTGNYKIVVDESNDRACNTGDLKIKCVYGSASKDTTANNNDNILDEFITILNEKLVKSPDITVLDSSKEIDVNSPDIIQSLLQDVDIIESLLEEPFRNRSDNEKEIIIKNNRPTPLLDMSLIKKNVRPGKIPDTFHTRYFQNKTYEKITWMCGSENLLKLFCWPCILFSNYQTSWTLGYDDLNCLSTRRKQHESSRSHIAAFVQLRKMEKQYGVQPIDNIEELKAGIKFQNKLITRNRYAVRKLIDVVCFMAQQGLPFLHQFDNHQLGLRTDNYIEIMRLCGKWDNLLNLEEINCSIAWLSVVTLNDIIQAITRILVEEIKNELQEAQCVAIILDEVIDTNRKKKISTIFRYGKNGDIREKFVGFEDIYDDKTSVSFTNFIMKQLLKYACEWKLVAYSNDEAIIDVDTHVKLSEQHPDITQVFYHDHTLNTLFVQALNSIDVCSIFFQSIKLFSQFLSKSKIIKYAMEQDLSLPFNLMGSIDCNYEKILNTLINQKTQLSSFFVNIFKNPKDWDYTTTTTAKALSSYLSELNFNILLDLFGRIFPVSGELCDMIKKNPYDIDTCINAVNNFTEYLKNEQYKKLPDVLSSDEYTDHPLAKRFRSMNENENSNTNDGHNLYQEIIDRLIKTTKTKFDNLHRLGFTALIDISKFKEYALQFPTNAFNQLKIRFPTKFNFIKLNTEISIIYSSPEYNFQNVFELKDYIIENDLSDILSEVLKLINFILTIPNTRTFVNMNEEASILQRIKSYAENSKNEESVSSTDLISIERNFLNYSLKSSKNFYDRVIDNLDKTKWNVELNFMT